MRSLLAGLLCLVALSAAGCAPGMSAMLQVRSAPPPPAFDFHGEPHFSYLPYYDLSVVADDSFGYDLFQCDGGYYLYSGGYWYRSGEPRGPFVAIDVRRVPSRILDVDDHSYHWRSHPRDWAARHDDDHGRWRDRNRDDGR